MIHCKIKSCKKFSNTIHGGRKGFCNIHYRRFLRTGDPLKLFRRENGMGCIVPQGYKKIQVNKYLQYEHRVVMENFLKRKLKKTEIIHHKNENKLDNRLKNLEILNRGSHMKYHMNERYKHLYIPCDHCGTIFKCSSWRKKQYKNVYCSLKCLNEEKHIGGKSCRYT